MNFISEGWESPIIKINSRIKKKNKQRQVDVIIFEIIRLFLKM